MRDTLLVIHILSVGAWIGTNVVQILLNPGIGDKGPVIAADWHRTLVKFGRFVYMPAAIVILITGPMLIVVDDSPYEMADAFVSIGFVAVFFGAGMGMAFFPKQSRAAAAAYDAGDAATAGAIERNINIAGMVDTAVIVLTVIAMVGKWGA
jgi:hypothetical protein